MARNLTSNDFAKEGELPALPEGKTCADCKKFEWCQGMFGRGGHHTDCLWKPDAAGFEAKENEN